MGRLFRVSSTLQLLSENRCKLLIVTLDRDSSESSVFVIEPEDIKRLTDFLENDFADVNFTLKCSDKLSRNMSVDELLVYENPKAKRIKTLTLSNTYNLGC